MTKRPPAYTDHLALLEDHLSRLELRLRAKILRRRSDNAEMGDANLLAIPDAEHADPDELDARAAELGRQIEARQKATDQTKVRLPLVELVERFELDAFERDVILLALAPSLELKFRRYFGMLRDDPFKGEFDVDGALSLLCEGGVAARVRYRRYFATDSRLVQNHLLSLDRHRVEMGDSFLSLAIRLPPRVMGWLLGEDNLDEALQGFTKLIDPDVSFKDVVLQPSMEASIQTMIQNHAEYLQSLKDWELDKTITYGRGVVLLFVGPPGTGKTMTAKAIAHELKMQLLLVDPQQIFDVKRPIEDNLSELFREARLQNAVVFFDECEALLGRRTQGNAQVSLILSAIEHYDGIIVLATNMPQLLDDALDRRILYRVGFEPPSVSLRQRIWKTHLPPGVPLSDDVDMGLLSRTFDFTGGYIKNAVLVAINRALSRPERPVKISHEDLDVAARTQMRARLHEYADANPTTMRLTDLILPEETSRQIHEILDAARSRSVVFQEWGFGKKLSKGRGLSALFDGEPGTGKTLCAEILAAELGLTLYQIQVANVVSKYIGETEKNLQRVFKEADQSHCLLLFDEADSLFSQRTDVKTANDKYANMEINVLLQLMERYDGLVVLTTNLKKGIDKAFERRLSFKVNFPFPEPDVREEIWRHLIPDECPVDQGIDYWAMGRAFELSGGSIKNSIVRAAYRAASRKRPITQEDFIEAGKYECAASGKLYRLPKSFDEEF